MKSLGTLIAVRDIEKSKRFYCDFLDQKVLSDFGANIVLDGGVFLQTSETWQAFIKKSEDEILFENNASEIYFEVEDIDLFMNKLDTCDSIRFVHPLIEHDWGQRVVRFYDPDGHIIEVGENIEMVVRRFIKSGLSTKETAIRMDVPEDFIITSLQEPMRSI